MTKKKKRMSKGTLIRKAKGFCAGLFRYVLIICLSYLILAPILINISTAFTNPRDLSFPSSIWIPARFSIENWHVSMLMLNYGKALPYTLFFTAIITVLQTVSAMMAGYSFARLKFPGRSILFALSVFTIVVPPQMFMLPQYLFFKEFDIFGIFRLITGQPINLLKSGSLFILNALCMGLKSGLYIYIFRQSFRALPKVLEEAAYMDGAGFLRTFTSIVVP
ncbi:MAG: carbohydrate ABC transporter permease, partial [Clostridia bacterium]|nr:carbohydrate ABC transporter permease [Clostridia bacterium]